MKKIEKKVEKRMDRKSKHQKPRQAPKRKPFRAPGRLLRAAAAAHVRIDPQDVALAYEAMPQAFPAVPIMELSSERDAFCPRATVRTRVFNTFQVIPNSVLLLCPSPLSYGQESSQAIGAASGLLYDGDAFPISEMNPIFKNVTNSAMSYVGDPWTQDGALGPTWISTNTTDYTAWSDHGVDFNVSPGSMTPDKCGGVSLAGGIFLVNVVCPFEATAQVYSFGPSDAANVQGICTGDSWKENPMCTGSTPNVPFNTAVEPRRQFARSAYFHAKVDEEVGATMNDILSNVKPDLISGASDVARRVYGFSLVPDHQFTPLNDFGAQMEEVPDDILCPDYYNNNPLSGLFQGQGIIYIYNSGSAPLTVTAELYADFDITLNRDAQKYLSPDTYALGVEGLAHTPVNAYGFPAIAAKTEIEVALRCAMARLPRAKRTKKFAKVLVQLIKSWFRNRTNLVNGIAKIIPKCQDPIDAAESVGATGPLAEVADEGAALNAAKSQEHSKPIGNQLEDFSEAMETGGMSEIADIVPGILKGL